MEYFDTLLPDGSQARLFMLKAGNLVAQVMDYGATLVSLFVPDREGKLADVVLGYDRAWDYAVNASNLGATVGRNANRIAGAAFTMGGKEYHLTPTEKSGNNLHSGPDIYNHRPWVVEMVSENAITLYLESPDGDQGFPGNAQIRVTYALEAPGTLRITYDGICDQDTVFNMTNHSYFNLAGHDKPELAMDQQLWLNADHFTPADGRSIPTGELRDVTGTPMDFRTPKTVGRDLEQDYEPLRLQKGYDHNFVVVGNPCAKLTDLQSGRMMQVYTDCPGLQFYSGNYLNKHGKDGAYYPKHSAICLETQFFPDSVNHPEWKQPFVKAGKQYHSETKYVFSLDRG